MTRHTRFRLVLTVAAVFCLLVGVVAAASAVEVDATDNRVLKQEARSTFVGEFKSDVKARIGPVDHVGNCAPTKTRCVVEYRLYTRWECWRVVYFRPGLPFTSRTVGPWRLETWTMRYHPQGCLP